MDGGDDREDVRRPLRSGKLALRMRSEAWKRDADTFCSAHTLQIFDGIPTHPPHGPAPTNTDTSPAPPPVSMDQQPGSIPYHTSDHNVPLATRPVSLVYCPLFPNKVNPGYDPSGAAFSGSYNLKWTEEQVQTIRLTARANFKEGLECIRLVVGEAYQRRKAERLAREKAGQATNDKRTAPDGSQKTGSSQPDVQPVEGLPPASSLNPPAFLSKST